MLGLEEKYVVSLKPAIQEEREEEEKMDGKAIDKNRGKSNQAISERKEYNKPNGDTEDSDSEGSEEEEGEIQMPVDTIRDVGVLREDQQYLICYVRLKTENEV
jgi:hypothetical protein